MRFTDLHSHYLPGVDDGVRSSEEGVALCRALGAAGFGRVIATPHIRTAMFPNERETLGRAFEAFAAEAAGADASGDGAMPELGLAAEHFFDDVFWELFERGGSLPYPGGKAALIELPSETIPLGLDRLFFQMSVRGVRPVLAHPERYSPLFSETDSLDPILDVGALPLLDLMSLMGRYGRRPQEAAERMLEEGVYYAACSDAHRPSDVPIVAQAIERLTALVGADERDELLGTNPVRILEGRADP
ncbi:MAG: protein tyrosine phosphatase [Myxococcales bacterium]|nr:protein tyrosine phosphatase [Myxococcales bacterium]